MTDYFALLNEPRRPWVDAEALKAKFLELSAQWHPDRVHSLSEAERASAQERYVALNSAYNALRDPKDRLRHLIALETGARPGDIRQIPSDLMDEFMQVGEACRRADLLLDEKPPSPSPMLKLKFFERSQAETDRLLELRKQLDEKRGRLLETLRNLDAAWAVARAGQPEHAALIKPLEHLLHLFGFYDRWLSQLQERIARLSF